MKEIRQYTEYAFVSEDLNIETLREIGIQNCDVVIVCIGEKVDVSILTTMRVLELGVPNVIAKALSPEQGAVLNKLGAKVVYPERDTGTRVAKSLVSSTFTDWIELSSEYSLTEAQMPEQWIGRSLSELRVREKYGVNVVGVRQGEEVDVTWDPHEPLPAEGVLIIIGSNEVLERFEAKR